MKPLGFEETPKGSPSAFCTHRHMDKCTFWPFFYIYGNRGSSTKNIFCSKVHEMHTFAQKIMFLTPTLGVGVGSQVPKFFLPGIQ